MSRMTDATSATPDARLLAQLETSGADLSRLHRFEFVLHMPAQKAAQRAQMQLLGLAFDTTIARGNQPGGWVVRATKILYPV